MPRRKKTVSQFLRNYYVYQAMFMLFPWLPVFYEFQDQIGLDANQIFRIQSLYFIAFCFLEIPTGLFADRWGYRLALRLGAVFGVVGNLIPIFWWSYSGMLTHFLTIAIARSLFSGASSAYLFTYLKMSGFSRTYKSAEGNARAAIVFLRIFFWGSAGMLMSWKITLPYWISVGTGVLALAAAFRLPLLPEEKREETAQGHSFDFIGLLKRMWKTPLLPLVILQGLGLFLFARIFINLFQPILKEKGFEVVAFGWILGAMSLAEVLAVRKTAVLSRWMSDWTAVVVLTCGAGAALLGMAYFGQVGTLASLMVLGATTGVAVPIQRQLMNEVIPDARFRATFLSLESISQRLVASWIMILAGTYVARGEMARFLEGSAGVAVVWVGVCFVLILPHRTAPDDYDEN